jgi:hypothetical protein
MEQGVGLWRFFFRLYLLVFTFFCCLYLGWGLSWDVGERNICYALGKVSFKKIRVQLAKTDLLIYHSRPSPAVLGM